MRRVILPADITRLRVERREPPLGLVHRIEYLRQRVLATEPKLSRSRDLEVSLELYVPAPVHSGHEQRVAFRAERGAVPLDATLNARTEAHRVIPRKRHVHVLAGRRRRLRQEREDGSWFGNPLQNQEIVMDKDRIAGAGKQAAGAVKDAAGKLTGDKKLQGEGKAEKAEGNVQNAFGKAKDALRDSK